MKKFYLIMLGILLIGLSGCKEKTTLQAKKVVKNTESGLPLLVAQAFEEKYPDQKATSWKKDDLGYWEVIYEKDGKKYHADFTIEGAWIDTENSIKKEELPDAVKKTIEEKYPDLELVRIGHVVSSRHESDFYDVEFRKEEKEMDVEIKEDGTVITVKEKS
ncbi:hypothetical protein C7S20_14355 [Christiangramia fulva]|uniref:Putative beta-lactamase-inhibitor-like PepSY-like domain-containing protein n=1 Tax=Christiangramia fulva TaxID=2126553 RepID=A0A2R3Z7Z9_9FLAO|nr:PepSY-like domain-containing protein [Christiangramia fulva]AVR46352.1 hypothetical protein C7S20_14355 [Christiangramia fulva]